MDHMPPDQSLVCRVRFNDFASGAPRCTPPAGAAL